MRTKRSMKDDLEDEKEEEEEREGRLEVSPASVGRAMGGDGRTIHSQAAPLSRPVDAGFVIFELSSFGEVQLKMLFWPHVNFVLKVHSNVSHKFKSLFMSMQNALSQSFHSYLRKGPIYHSSGSPIYYRL